MKEKAYELLKMDLGLTSEKRKLYFESLIDSSISEIEKKGIRLEERPEDIALVAEYAAWRYRSRESEKGMSRRIQYLIRNRIIENRSRGKDNV